MVKIVRQWRRNRGVLARVDAGKYLTVAPSRKMGVVKFPNFCLNVKTSIVNVLPQQAQALISSPFDNFHTSITTDEYTTLAIPVHISVLQGDFLRPLLFNMCFNAFIQYNGKEKYKQFRFFPHDENARPYNPMHWFQFADDTAVVTTDKRENQLLLNCFTKWCQWSVMKSRVEKCVVFGLRKLPTCSMQLKPKNFNQSSL